jgi:sensor histidine kinase regulating citrate/malate metabolism
MRHITLIHSLAKSKEYAKLEEYTQELSVTTENMIKIVHTGNVILDAIFNEKYATAKSHDIDIKYMIEGIDQDVINPTSLCIIVSNILDNAIEGTFQWKKEHNHAFVEVKLYLQKRNLIFSVSNDAVKPEVKEGLFLTNKENKKEHGIGLKNVKKVIEENKGCFEAGYSNGKFIFVCRIPINDK